MGIKKKHRFECDICGKLLTTKNFIRRHIGIHIRECQTGGNGVMAPTPRHVRPLMTCNGCDRTFVSRGSLLRHIRHHPGEHSFPCSLCDGKFYSQADLNKHKEKHVSLNIRVPPSTGIQPHTCSHCGLVFKNEDDVQVHSAETHGEFSVNLIFDPYCCSVCIKPFVSQEGLQYHMEHMHKDDNPNEKEEKTEKSTSVTSGPTSQCKICSETFNSTLGLKLHLKSHNVKKNVSLKPGSLKCLICPRTFLAGDGLKYHLATHTGERPFACELCPKKFIKRTHLTSHMAIHSDEKKFFCNRCPRSFHSEATRNKHIKAFPGPHNFFCPKCGKVFMKESALEKHLCVDLGSSALAPEVVASLSEDLIEEYLCRAEEADIESGKQGPTCCKCWRSFPSEDALQTHQLDHLDKRQTYFCRFCPENFLRVDDFSRHIEMHLGDKTPYMCKHCKRKFKSRFTLATHLKNNPGEHNFTCLKCKRRFPSASRLEKHECILELNDVFKCACDKEFRSWQDFVNHFSRTRPLKCCSCSQEYVSTAYLTRHVKRHTDHRPFCCKICPKTFRNKKTLLSHEKVHEREDIHRCTMCEFTTRQKKVLTGHLHRKHNIKSTTTLCQVCGMQFSSGAEMEAHMREEHDTFIVEADKITKPLMESTLCILCGKLLSSAYGLRVHMNVMHNANGPAKIFTCEACGKAFKSIKQLNKHIERQHDIEGPRPCPTCGSVFYNNREMRRHQRKHDTHKPFSCSQCGKFFKVAVSLKYHTKICSKKMDATRVEDEETSEVQFDSVCEMDCEGKWPYIIVPHNDGSGSLQQL